MRRDFKTKNFQHQAYRRSLPGLCLCIWRLFKVFFSLFPFPFSLLFLAVGCGRHTGTTLAPAAYGNTAPVATTALRFVDVTAPAGISWQRSNGAFGKKWFPEAAGGGGAFLDYDNDGYLDILLVNGDWWPGHPLPGKRPTLALYHNNHNGTFTDVTAQVGLNISIQGMGVAVGDYDNDGYDDIYITGVDGNRLFHNEGGKRFKDVTAQAGVGGSGWSTSAAWIDVDGDGLLDLFVCHYVKWTAATDVYCGGKFKIYCTPGAYTGQSCHLYHNDGNGHFHDITRQAGLYNDSAKALGVCTVDFDRNGRPGLLVANDGEPNFAYINLGHGKFKDVSSESGLALTEDGKPHNGMGIDAADYRNDGTLGIMVGNFSFQGISLQQETQPGLFQDVARQAGIQQPSYPFVTFGVLFADLDNDGWKDAVITNGHTDDLVDKSQPNQHVLQPTQIFANRRNGTFADVTAQAGPGLAQSLVGRGLAAGDFDNDGRLDLLLIPNTGPPRLLHNETPATHHWLTLSLAGTGAHCNHDAYGAQVKITAGGLIQSDTVRSGSSYCSQSDKRLHFGLGTASTVDTIEIRWPDGRKDVWTHVPADKLYTIKQGVKVLRAGVGR